MPKEKGGTTEDVELLCAQCHGMVHATYTNRTLASLYLTIEQLRQTAELASYLKWVRKQPPRGENAIRPGGESYNPPSPISHSPEVLS